MEKHQLTAWGKNYAQKLRDARDGKHIGMENGMPGLNKYLYGTHVGRYYLIGADSGVGKTTIADFMFVINLFLDCKAKGVKLKLVYYSFEISREEKTARWLSLFINWMYGVSLPSDYLRGRIKGHMVTDEHMDMVDEAMIAVDEIMQGIYFIEDPVHPTKMFHDVIEGIYETIGTVKRAKSRDETKKGMIIGFQPHASHERTMVVSIVDHLALAQPEQGLDTKHTMDLWSRYLVTLRNIFAHTSIVIQQFNTELTSTIRMQKKGDGLLAPQRIDFGDSRYTFRDADVVIGLLKPRQYDVDHFQGYDIKRLRDYLIAAYIMKNRWGAAGKCIPLFLNPLVGIPEDLPLTPHLDIAMHPYYDKADALDKCVLQFTPQTEKLIIYGNNTSVRTGESGNNITKDSHSLLPAQSGEDGRAHQVAVLPDC